MLLGCPTQNIQVIYIKRFLFYAIINYSRISANRHLSTCTIATFFRPGGQKIHALTLVLNLSTAVTFFCPQRGCCREVQLYQLRQEYWKIEKIWCSKQFKPLSPGRMNWECAFLYNLWNYIPGRWSLKIKCGPWKVLKKWLRFFVCTA